MKAKIIEPSNDLWLRAIKNLYLKGEIDIHQYGACLRRMNEYEEKEKNANRKCSII